MDAELRSNILQSEHIMKHGHLIAIRTDVLDSKYSVQYWVYDGVLYSISSCNHHNSWWCDVNGLRAHCKHLEHVIGHKHFRDDEYMHVIDKDFVERYC